jgi:predicted RNA polymerase sigma factor
MATCGDCEHDGFAAEQDGRWAEAQSLYVRGRACAPADEPQCRVYLSRAIRREILAGSAPDPFAGMKGIPPLPDDPRQKLPVELQAVIWAERGRMFEHLGRVVEATLAFERARQLTPTNEQYRLDAARTALLEAQRLGCDRAPVRTENVRTITICVSQNAGSFWLPALSLPSPNVLGPADESH